MVHIFWLIPAALAGAIVQALILFVLAQLHTYDRRTDTYVYNPDTQRWEKPA